MKREEEVDEPGRLDGVLKPRMDANGREFWKAEELTTEYSEYTEVESGGGGV